jgi:hypothetical protein
MTIMMAQTMPSPFGLLITTSCVLMLLMVVVS